MPLTPGQILNNRYSIVKFLVAIAIMRLSIRKLYTPRRGDFGGLSPVHGGKYKTLACSSLVEQWLFGRMVEELEPSALILPG